MHPFNVAGIAVALAAVVALCCGLPECWFFSLLALACLLGSVAEAYRENEAGAVGLLAAGGLMSTMSAVAVFRDSRARRNRTRR